MRNQIICILIGIVACMSSAYAQSKANKYENCCGDEAKIYDIKGVKIYVPNLITPNGDKINDAFYPIASNMKRGSFAVANFQVFDEDKNLIFFMPRMDVENAEVWSFTGIASKRPYKPAEEQNYEYTGRFFYKFLLAVADGKGGEELKEVEGSGCVVRCDADAKIVKSKMNCNFPSQGNGGVFDKSKASKETNCIE